ncbi:MAG: lasso peptide biosynthesis B2 protein [Chloroflexota bacterium]|nr:lasso peptide biosynthesis B2 protein [Chloroflexota bacterium]
MYFAVSQLGFLLPSGFLVGRWVVHALEAPASARHDAAEARRLARIAHAVALRWPLESRCLQRSLVLCWMLRRRGLGGRMQIGVRRTGRGVSAHAWVIDDDAIINDDEAHCSAFSVLETPTARAAVAAGMEYPP